MVRGARPGRLSSALTAVATLALATVACGSGSNTPADDEEQPPPPGTCEPPNRVVDDRCVEPGVQDDGCPAGTVAQDDSSCAPAGVAPPPPCADGLIAAVGAERCAPIMSCGSGPWGDLPVDAATQYVDRSFTGASNGSSTAPWTTVTEGVNAAPAGGLVAVAAGIYDENITIAGKAVRLWGICPDAVTITGGAPATVFVGSGASGTVIGGVTVTGSSIGIGVTGAVDVLVDRVLIRNTASRGINLEALLGETAVTVRDSLVEQATEFGVFVSASAMTLERVVVRDTRPAGLALGRGLNAKSASQGPAALHVVDSVIERSADQGIYAASSLATLERVVVRQSGGDGAGFTIADAGSPPTVANVSHSVFEANHLTGIYVIESEATLTGVVVRDTLPRASDQVGGRGLSAEIGAVVNVVGSVFERNTNISLFVGGATANLIGVAVRDTFPNATDQLDGRGINVENAIAGGTPSIATISGSLVERNSELSLTVLGSSAQILGTWIRDSYLQVPTGLGGRGITVQASLSTGERSTASIASTLVENSRDAGLVVGGADATADGLVVRETTGDGTESFGDGILVTSDLGATTLDLRRSSVENSARAGLSNFSGHITLQDTTLSCQAFDIASEELPGTGLEPILENLGGNACGCPAEPDACKSATAGIQPPSPLD